MKETKFYGVYEDNGRFYTKNLAPGRMVYGEKIIRLGNNEFREWDPRRSKLSAALHKSISQLGIKPGDVVLYLGSGTGTTVSHVSDLVGKEGFVFAIDVAPVAMRSLVFVADERPNIAPMLFDAHKPLTYASMLCEIDVIFQDIAQKDQVDIFLKNIKLFLKPGGFAILSLKARSVDVTMQPSVLFKKIRADLERSLTVSDYRILDPLEADHCLYVCKYTTPLT